MALSLSGQAKRRWQSALSPGGTLARLIRLLLARLVVVLIAGLLIVLVLHIEMGTRPANLGVQTRFSATVMLEHVLSYLKGLAHGELGRTSGLAGVGSLTVAQALRKYGPNSALLFGGSLLLSLAAGTLLGLLTSRLGSRWLRPPALSLSLFLISLPDVPVVVLLFRGVTKLLQIPVSAFNTAGGVASPLHVMVATAALSALSAGIVSRVTAVALDEVCDQPYIRTALAKGVSPLRLIRRHAMKNAWIRVIEVMPLIMASLMTSLVVVEYLLGFPGLGRLLGLLVERGGQSSAMTGIALTFLLVAALIDLLVQGVRHALDPRLAEPLRERPVIGDGDWVSWLKEMQAGRREWPERFREWLWRNRPGQMLLVIRQNPPLLLGLMGVGLLLAAALFGGRFVDLIDQKQLVHYVVENGAIRYPPYPPGTPGFPLGSDMAGRDVWTRLLIGARYTLFFTLAVTPVRLLIAVPWGMRAGLGGSLAAAATSRILGLVVSALPLMLIPASLLQALRAANLHPLEAGGFWLITGILALVGIPRLSEQVRMQVEAIRVQPFVEGAVAAGADSRRILWRHIFPHLLPQLWVTAAADMAWTLLLLAQFGLFSVYLGGSVLVSTGYEGVLGARTLLVPRIPDWSSMLANPVLPMMGAPWSLYYPGIAFLLAVTVFSLLAEGLRRVSARLTGGWGGEAQPRERPEILVSQQGRRLALEWGALLAVFLLLLGVTVRYASENQAVYAAAAVQPTLEKARLSMNAILQVALESPKGAGEKALPLVEKTVEEYLLHAYKAGYSATQMEEDSLHRLQVRQLRAFRLVSLSIAEEVHHFVVDENRGHIVRIPAARVPGQPESIPLGPDGRIETVPKESLTLCPPAGECTTLRWSGKGWEGP